MAPRSRAHALAASSSALPTPSRAPLADRPRGPRPRRGSRSEPSHVLVGGAEADQPPSPPRRPARRRRGTRSPRRRATAARRSSQVAGRDARRREQPLVQPAHIAAPRPAAPARTSTLIGARRTRGRRRQWRRACDRRQTSPRRSSATEDASSACDPAPAIAHLDATSQAWSRRSPSPSRPPRRCQPSGGAGFSSHAKLESSARVAAGARIGRAARRSLSERIAAGIALAGAVSTLAEPRRRRTRRRQHGSPRSIGDVCATPSRAHRARVVRRPGTAPEPIRLQPTRSSRPRPLGAGVGSAVRVPDLGQARRAGVLVRLTA